MISVSVMIAVGSHLFPFRTEKLKPPAPKILEEISGKIGRRRDITHNICLNGYPPPWTSPIAFHTMVSSDALLVFAQRQIEWSSPGF